MILYLKTIEVVPDVLELIENVIGVGVLTYGVKTNATCAAIL